MPLDHSVVFDGGWRTLVGQVPFRDYTTPNALTPSFLQAFFFLVFGVTWKAYVLHATVFNGLFSVLVYVLLRLCGGSRPTAVLYGALSGLVFYPPLGVPFHDQHAFFFVLLAVTLGVAARGARGRLGVVLWTIVPFALVAAALSKQTPALLGAPIVLGLALAPGSSIRRAVTGLLIGSVASLSVVLAAGLALRVDWNLVWLYLVELPIGTGADRGGRADGTASSLFALAALFPLLVFLPALILSRMRRQPMRLRPGVLLPLSLSAAFMATCGAFATLTLNESTEGLALFFASFGLFQIAVVRAVPDWPVVSGRLMLASTVGLLVAVLALVAGWRYDMRVNERRSANNIIYDEALVERDLPPALETMRFQVPLRYPGMHADDLRRLTTYLRAAPGRFVHIGDTSVINGLTDTPPVFPALFFSVGLTVPESGEELDAFENRLFERLERLDVRRVVLERRTYEGGSIEDLPRFRAWVVRCRSTTRAFGFFRVVEISDRPSCS